MNETSIETTKDIATLNIQMEKQPSRIYVSNHEHFAIIKSVILEHYNLEWKRVWQSGRQDRNVLARSVIYYFMREFTDTTLKWLGEQFNGKDNKPLDHSSVCNGIEKVKERLSYDVKFRNEIAWIKAKIKENELFKNS